MQTSAKHFRKRDAILSYLRQTTAHPSAETIYTDLKQQIPDLAMGTVYRNLTLFKENGTVTSVATVRGVERFDANTEPHVHLICSGCDAVVDLMDLQVPQALCEQAADQSGGAVESCQLSFTGLCRNCSKHERKKTL